MLRWWRKRAYGTDNLDNMDYQAAQDKLDQLMQLVDADSPIVTEMRTRLKMETS